MNSVELTKIDRLIEQVFDAITFRKGDNPTMHQLQDLFVDSGIMINYNDDNPFIVTVQEFVSHFEALVESGEVEELEDAEVDSRTEIYDRVAHRFSFYEARHAADDPKPFAVGVNSMQMIRVNGAWKLTSMAWNDDNRGDGFFKRIVSSAG